MRSAFLPLLAIALVAGTPAAAPGQVIYSVTPVAVTGSGSPYSRVFPPTLNAAGTAAFGANLTAGGSGIFIGGGGPVTTIAQTGTTYTGFTFGSSDIYPAISPTSNTTAFFAGRTAAAGGGTGVFSGDGGPVSTIVATGGGSPFTLIFGPYPGFNTGGTVAFSANSSMGNGDFISDGGPVTTIATTGPMFSSFSGMARINASNAVSFSAALTGGGSGIFRGNGTTTTPIAVTGATYSAFPGGTDVNALGRVAFVADLTGGGRGVFTGDGGPVTTVATTGSTFASLGDFASINTAGGVAFTATLPGGIQGVFTGLGPLTAPVVRTGDPLAGSTVTSLAITTPALNDLGQVAFWAQLADGRQGVFVASPVPEPSGLLLAGGACLVAGTGWLTRRKSKRDGNPTADAPSGRPIL